MDDVIVDIRNDNPTLLIDIDYSPTLTVDIASSIFVAEITPPQTIEINVSQLGQRGPRGLVGSGSRGFIWTQELPQAVWGPIPHLLTSEVPPMVIVFSLDYSIQWDNVIQQRLDADTSRLSFEEPTAGIALFIGGI